MIEKGKVSAVLANGSKVTVVPAFSGDVVSHELNVPFYLVGIMEPGKEVVYCSFPDNTGMVLSALDGEWNHKLAGNVIVEGDVTANGVSVSKHRHSDSEGGTTSGPH